MAALKIEPSFKGWDLYSWPGNNRDCAEWNFAILPGTNGLKSYRAVISDSVSLKASGNRELKLLLSKFPVNEPILWVGENWLNNSWTPGNISYGDLKLPPPAVQSEILEHCKQAGLNVTIVQ